MAELGSTAYRFSIAWPRIVPERPGRSTPTRARLLRPAGRRAAGGRDPPDRHALPLGPAAGARGPRRLADRDTAARFAEYAGVVADRLGDRVAMWNTLNEPWCSAFWVRRRRARPRPHLYPDALAAAHHLLLAHGAAAEILRARCPEAQVSIALNAGTGPAGDRARTTTGTRPA